MHDAPTFQFFRWRIYHSPRGFLFTPWGLFHGRGHIARLGEDQSVLISVARIEREKIKMFGMTIMEKELTTAVSRKILELDKQHNYRKIYIDIGGVG